jgi:predicted acyltransferase
LLIHSSILLGVGAPGIPSGTLEKGHNVDDWLDLQIFTPEHTLDAKGDPEGLLSILSATALVLLGLCFGRTLQLRDKNWKTVTILLLGGIIAILLGITISQILPVNKQLWTSSFILICAGIGTLVLGFNVRLPVYSTMAQWVFWAIPMGRNALVIYIMSIAFTIPMHMDFFTNMGDIPLSFYDIMTAYFMGIFGNSGGIVVYGLLVVLIWLIVAFILHWRRIYIKLDSMFPLLSNLKFSIN